MSKAEQRAFEAYPKDIEEFIDVNGMKSVVDNNSWQRTIFLKGYHQAEKDLELTWEDIRKIVIIYENVLNDKDFNTLPIKDGYQEVLKRFNKERRISNEHI